MSVGGKRNGEVMGVDPVVGTMLLLALVRGCGAVVFWERDDAGCAQADQNVWQFWLLFLL